MSKFTDIAFLDQLISDPLNPALCRQVGIEIVSAPADIDFSCPCPARLHCTSDTKHPACEVCDECHSAIPATCLADGDYDFKASDDDILPPWTLARMGY